MVLFILLIAFGIYFFSTFDDEERLESDFCLRLILAIGAFSFAFALLDNAC